MPDPKKIMVKVPIKKSALASSKKDNSSSDIELTKKYTESIDEVKKNIDTEKGKSFVEKTEGISIDRDKMAAKPVMIKRKIIKTGGENGTTRILSADGKTVKYEGRSNMASTKEALRSNENKDKDTNNRRDVNSNYFNISTGAKPELDEKDKASLLRNGKAILKK